MSDEYNVALVERVRSFVNTEDRQDEHDVLTSPQALVEWLAQMDLLDDDEASGRPPASAADLALAVELRSTLRELLRHGDPGSDHHDPAGNKGEASPGPGGRDKRIAPDSQTRRRVERLSERLPLRVVLCSDGQPYLAPVVVGARYGLARILAAVAAMSPDDWNRLKVCRADDCAWVFYDSSRNRSRRWCSMEGCGNRSKVRAFRSRS